MKVIFFAVGISIFLPVVALAFGNDVQVDGYSRRDGSYVQPHYRSSPDGNTSNNYSSQGNQNPYTGAYGSQSGGGSSQSIDSSPSSNSFGSPRESLGGNGRPGSMY